MLKALSVDKDGMAIHGFVGVRLAPTLLGVLQVQCLNSERFGAAIERNEKEHCQKRQPSRVIYFHKRKVSKVRRARHCQGKRILYLWVEKPDSGRERQSRRAWQRRYASEELFQPNTRYRLRNCLERSGLRNQCRGKPRG